MKTDDLPESKNLVDRRGKGHLTLAEHLAEPRAEPMTPDPNSTLAQQAGVKDIA